MAGRISGLVWGGIRILLFPGTGGGRESSSVDSEMSCYVS